MNWQIKDIEHELKKDGEVVTKRLEKWAKEDSDRVFIYYGESDKEFTFGEFNQLANNVGHNLGKMGIAKGDKVSVFVTNPLISALSMFGVWKIGAAYCPINYNYKGKLLSYQVNDTAPSVLITEKKLIPRLNEVKEDMPALDIVVYEPEVGEHDYDESTSGSELDSKFQQYLFNDLTEGSYPNPAIEMHYSDISSIIYTSGTTGNPKGVVQTYRWINNYIFNLRQLTSQDDVILSDLPMYHIGAAFFNVGRAAWVGCKVAIYDKFSSTNYWERIKTTGATTTALLDVMCPWLMNAEESPDDRFNTLNKVYMQPLPLYHQQICKRFGFDFVLTGYNQTEAGNGSYVIIDELDKDEGTPEHLYKGFDREKIVSIAHKYNMAVASGKDEHKKGLMGKPSLLMDAAIVNTFDEECETGEIGELVFRNRFPNMMLKEYYNNDEATLEAFSNLWFHTGDAAYKDEKGNYYFVDRMKGAIRVKGELVSSFQLEDIINGHKQVSACAAFAIPAEVGSEDDIVVYIVPDQRGALSEEGLRAWMREQMPKAMWPKHIRFIDDLPKTPTNKIEKYKLRDKILQEIRPENNKE